jgi:hypothetical protein
VIPGAIILFCSALPIGVIEPKETGGWVAINPQELLGQLLKVLEGDGSERDEIERAATGWLILGAGTEAEDREFKTILVAICRTAWSGVAMPGVGAGWLAGDSAAIAVCEIADINNTPPNTGVRTHQILFIANYPIGNFAISQLYTVCWKIGVISSAKSIIPKMSHFN